MFVFLQDKMFFFLTVLVTTGTNYEVDRFKLPGIVDMICLTVSTQSSFERIIDSIGILKGDIVVM